MGDATRHGLEHVRGLARHFTIDSLRAHLLRRATRTASGCLEYQGYGRNRRIYQKMTTRAWAHIAAYAAFVGDYDPALDVEHACGNPPCIEPTHLRQMTHAENMGRLRGRPKRGGCTHRRERAESGRLKPCATCNAANQRRWRQRQAGELRAEEFRPWVVDPPQPLFDLAA